MMRASLPRLIDLAAQLEQDQARAPDVLRRRDRALGREIGDATRDPEAGVAAWLDRLRPEDAESEGVRAERAGRLMVTALCVVGSLVGAAMAAALFYYDGSHPVNVVRVLAVFVAFQLALLAATLVLCLPEAWRRFVPGLAALQDALVLLSPGRWQGVLRRLLPGPQREAVVRLAGLARRHQRLYGRVQKWWLLSCSQSFGVSFNLGVLVVAFYLIAFTDLAFAWSTTLDVEAATLERVTHGLSRPWASAWPAAVPAPELIAATQYFRAEGGHVAGSSAPWWRFLVACIALYGLLPRVAVLLWARLRLRVAVRTAFQRVPGVAALRDRLESRLVETGALNDEPESPPGALQGRAGTGSLTPGVACRALIWSGFPIADAAAASSALGIEVKSLHLAGAGALEQDAAAVRALADAAGDEPILVVVKAWEPLVLELLDFLRELRAALGDGRAILVVPLALDAGSRPAPPAAVDAQQWQRAADRLGDPGTSVHTVGTPA